MLTEPNQQKNKFYRTKTAQKVIINSILQDKIENAPIGVDEFINYGMRSTFNLVKPKFGLKNYVLHDNMHIEPYYKNNNKNGGV